MNKKIVLSIIFFMAVSTFSAMAQSTLSQEDIAKLRSEYSSLESKLDSMQKELNECRNNYDLDPEKYGSKIVSLEGKIFDVREHQSLISRRLATVPQQTQTEVKKSDSKFGGKNISDSPFFAESVSKEDLDLFKSASSVYSFLDKSKEDIDSKYDSLKSMKERFDKTESQGDVDKIIIESENLKNKIAEADANIATKWKKYYDARIDNYLVMLDKLGNVSRSKLEALDNLARQAQSSVNPDETLAPSIADLSAQNRLILAYEEILAERLGYTAALDSIKHKISAYQSSDLVLYPDIAFPYRVTFNYVPLSTGHDYSNKSTSDIPAIKVPSSGIVYSVQLLEYPQQVKQMSTFKGIEPLMVHKVTGKYLYLAGTYRTYDEAAKGLSKAKQLYFRYPKIVAWVNGKFTAASTAKTMESAVAEQGYCVDIKSTSQSIESYIKDVIDIHAKDKTWISNDTPTGRVYRIMTFESRDEAVVIGQVIKTKDPSAEINIVENN